MKITTKIFKGKPVLGFYRKADDSYPALSFGVGKAKIILENVEIIREFVRVNETTPETVVQTGEASE